MYELNVPVYLKVYLTEGIILHEQSLCVNQPLNSYTLYSMLARRFLVCHGYSWVNPLGSQCYGQPKLIKTETGCGEKC